MAKTPVFNVSFESPDLERRDLVDRVLREELGVHGLRFTSLDEAESTTPDLLATHNPSSHQFNLEYSTDDGMSRETSSDSSEDIRRALSQFAVRRLVIPIDGQSSRVDYNLLTEYEGDSPNLDADPSLWIFGNPLLANLTRRFPSYGNLVRYLCNERGLFLKVGNLVIERAYWNSTLNGGLPVTRKSDPIHEGTFMLHDLFHFVQNDPLIGSAEMDSQKRAAYISHRLLSEASTLVLADMVGLEDAGVEKEGYDISKRRIFPVYQSIKNAQGNTPDVGKLLSANAYFCFTGEVDGFKLLGADSQTLEFYRQKYESIFSDDFMWNLHNFEAMVEERDSNPLFDEYYEWLDRQSPTFPLLENYSSKFTNDAGTIDISTLLSMFRGTYTSALNYDQPIDDFRRSKLAYMKYLAGQRVVFARFGGSIPAEQKLITFDAAYEDIVQAESLDQIATAGEKAKDVVGHYVSDLYEKSLILPHEAVLYRFSVPLYPVKFVNYERRKNHARLQEEMSEFITINEAQLRRLLESVST